MTDALVVSREILGKLGMSTDQCPVPDSQGVVNISYSEVLTKGNIVALKVNSAAKITSLRVLQRHSPHEGKS